ncbi:24698_t:CDS:2, partial [Racocetra persica]
NFNETLIQCIFSDDIIYIYGGLVMLNRTTMIKLNTLNLIWMESDLAQYNQILILYGYPDSSIMALDILKFEWSSPTISNDGPNTTLRSFTSILIGSYIFIAFGAP